MVARNVRVATPAPSRPAMSGRTRSASAVSGRSISLVTAITRPPTRNRRAASTVSRVRPDAEIATKTRSSAGGVGAEVDELGPCGDAGAAGFGGRRHRRIPRAAQAAELRDRLVDRRSLPMVRRPPRRRRAASRAQMARRRCPHGAARRDPRSRRASIEARRASPRSARTARPAGMSRHRRTRRAPCRPRRRAAGQGRCRPTRRSSRPASTPRGTARAPARSRRPGRGRRAQAPAVGGFAASTSAARDVVERAEHRGDVTQRQAMRPATSTGLSGSPSKSTIRNPSGAINTWPRW